MRPSMIRRLAGVRMPSVRLERVTALDALVQHIEEQILSGNLLPDQRLPGEATLAEQYGVSRPVVREALGQLRERGYVHTINGSGTYVQHPDVNTISDAIERHLRFSEGYQITVDHLYEAREAIEVCAARLAATRADKADHSHLSGLLAEMKAGRGDRSRYSAADMAFHVGVARASGNPLLPTLLTPLVRTILQGILESHSSPEGVDLGLAAHADILDHVRAGDGNEAAEAMSKHLADSRRLFPTRILERPVETR